MECRLTNHRLDSLTFLCYVFCVFQRGPSTNQADVTFQASSILTCISHQPSTTECHSAHGKTTFPMRTHTFAAYKVRLNLALCYGRQHYTQAVHIAFMPFKLSFDCFRYMPLCDFIPISSSPGTQPPRSAPLRKLHPCQT